MSESSFVRPMLRLLPGSRCTGAPRFLHLMRHGATLPNLLGLRCGGDLDVMLSDAGRAQAHSAAARVARMDLGFGLIVSSRLDRARETAAIVGAALGGLPILVEPLLDERRLGEWNLRSAARTEPLIAGGATPPGGEAEAEFRARVALALARIEPVLGLNPLVISSKGVARVLSILLMDERLVLDNGELARFPLAPRHEAIAPSEAAA